MACDGIHFHRLLVAVDGSPHADLSLAAAVSIALRERATITLIAVAHEATAGLAAAAPYMSPAVDQADLDAVAQQQLDRAVASIPVEIGVRTLLCRGRPGAEIVARAASGDFDAVLMGARGLGALRGAVGSVSQYVTRHAPITVLTAHQAQGPPLS